MPMSARYAGRQPLWDLNLQEVLNMTLENNEFRAHLKYEKREPLIESLDLVVNFDKEFRVSIP